MANKRNVKRLQLVIHHLHGCESRHIETVPVHEVFRGQTVWQGDVEVFNLTGHPKAKRCYAWSRSEPEHFVTVSELPPVDSPKSAVKIGVTCQIRKAS